MYTFLSGVIFPHAYCAFIQGKNGDKRKRSNSSKCLWCWVKQTSAPLALSQLILSILNKLIVPPALPFTAAVLPLVTVDGGCFLRNALFRCRENNRNIWEFCQRLPVKGVDTWAEPRSPTQSAVRMWVNQICQPTNLTSDNKTKLIMQYAFPNSPLTSEAKQKLLSGITWVLFKLIPLCFTRSIQFTAVLEALYFKSEHTKTNLSDIKFFPYGVNPNDPCQRGAKKLILLTF